MPMMSLEDAQREILRRGKIANSIIAQRNPELLELFQTYQNEALEARRFLHNSLIELEEGASILEIGGGILALSIQLASEGFEVTTVEPVGVGFKGIQNIMEVFNSIASHENTKFHLRNTHIEDTKFDDKFDFIFSINVMEHLQNPYSILLKLVTLLKHGAKYRFLCPNYDFPYEPHFGKWLYTRKNHAYFLEKGRARMRKLTVEEADEIYRSINFITLRLVSSFGESHKIGITANPNVFFDLLQRILRDQTLAKRHRYVSLAVLLIDHSKLTRFAKLVPTKFQPVMDIEAARLLQ
jgi:2-polyprenyl-3-methyl-5-hydroxy-6-metoxy-1,4-benzoquinol methylase